MSEPQQHSPPHDLTLLREWLEKMVAALRFVELVLAVVALIARMRDTNTALMKQLVNLRRARPRSETLARLEHQLQFSFLGLVPSPKKPDGRKTKKSRRGRHPGRTALPLHLERIQVLNPVPAALRICPTCGSEMTTVAHSVCETLDVIPARVVVVQRLDETVACPHDEVIVSAPPPSQLIERGVLGTTLVVESLADKYLQHTPIERQCLRFEGMGVPVAPQTLGRSVAAAIDLFVPVAKLIKEMTRGRGLLATDASCLPVLDRDAPDGIRMGTIWCWINQRWITFFYAPTGDGESVRRFLGEVIARIVQCDGTSVTNFIEREGGKRPGCWAHARRRLVAAAKAGDVLAIEGLRIIGRLFAVDRLSARELDSPEQRHARRLTESTPVLEEIRAWVDAHRGEIPPRTPMGKALGYLHRQWPRLVLFLEDGRLELTNNRVERELRKLVLGRRNWLFTWGDLGGERTATILTVVATCIAHAVNPRAYLHVVAKLLIEGWPMSRLRELLPDQITSLRPELRVPVLPRAQPPPALPAPA